MTTDEIIASYAKLLILQYVGLPKAYATIQATIGPIIMDQLPVAVQNAFAIDTAVGVQLDVIGKYAGVVRNVRTFSALVTLNDSDFRTFIRLKIIENNSYSSLSDIQNLLYMFFPTSLLVFDYANMHMDYFFDSAFGSKDLAEAFVRQGFLPRPMGVQLGSLIYAANIHNFFGFRTYLLPGFNVSPFNTYSSYTSGTPWLSYANAI